MLSLSMLRNVSIRLLIPLLISWITYFHLSPTICFAYSFPSKLTSAPFVVLALVIILSQPFNQGRIGIIAILMLESYFLILNFLQQPLANGDTRLIYILLSALLPLNLLLLHIVPEKRLLSRCGFAMLILIWFKLPYPLLLYGFTMDRHSLIGGMLFFILITIFHRYQ